MILKILLHIVHWKPQQSQYDTLKIIPNLEFAAAAESREIPAWLLLLFTQH